jgi:hypothetical protein
MSYRPANLFNYGPSGDIKSGYVNLQIWNLVPAGPVRGFRGIARVMIAPERLLRALLLQAFYTIRSERQLMEQLHYCIEERSHSSACRTACKSTNN